MKQNIFWTVENVWSCPEILNGEILCTNRRIFDI
jgi:hypothetical protein